ncbi:MAG TPA: hypothetical protein VE268_01410 [Herpetosiphonaceae bacterium]|nr:hypothetical protein [Herpetosiphonaceae bacterium]
MRKLTSLLGTLATVAFLITVTFNSAAAAKPEVQRGNPLHRPRNAARPSNGATVSNLVYHAGGAVQTGTHKTYAIYWGSNFSTNYKSIINSYFANVAADSGKTTNVYYSDTQYYQTIGGVTTNISYSESFVGAWSDMALPSTKGCSSTAGGSVCVSDAQVQAEVNKAIAAKGWPKGMGAEYFVFLGNGISTCYDSSNCAFTQFCAYHSSYGSGNSTVLYANMPYTGHNLSACGGGNYPNGDSAADATISVTSHEANETITDPLGNAWYDASGNENGDKCAWNFGTQLGGSAGKYYNQVINGAHYELQQEWSNYSSRCVLTGK